jgi:hypothetical protein
MAPPRHDQSYSNSRASEMGGDFRFWPLTTGRILAADCRLRGATDMRRLCCEQTFTKHKVTATKMREAA